MKVGSRPTDKQILAALKRAAGGSYAATYVVKNWLSMKEYGEFDDLNTSHVLYRLKRLEANGLVRRNNSHNLSIGYIYWEPIHA